MSVGTIFITQQLRVSNGLMQFPNLNTSLGISNAQIVQNAEGGGAPGEITAISTGQGTLVDLTTLPVAVGGGWCIFFNEDALITVSWGVDDGAGNIKIVGDMLPGEYAGPFRCSASQTKYRFKGASGSPKVQPFFFNP